VKQKLYQIKLQRPLLNFWKNLSFADTKCLNFFTNNGGEWSIEFDNMCKVHNTHHQYTTPQWPRCNRMAERLIKTIKHGIIMMSIFQKNARNGDLLLPKVLFGY
jgi:hypothetical protein